MSHSADPVLQNPFSYPSNAMANVSSDMSRSEMGSSVLVGPNDDEGASSGALSRNGDAGTRESGLRARRASRHDAPPPNLLSLNIPPSSDGPICGQRNNAPVHQPSPEETSIEGEHLFVNFIHEEVLNEGLREPEEFTTPVPASTPQETGAAESQGPDGHFERQGRLLRQIADDFARSSERRRVQAQANSVDLENIERRDFLRLLGGLFNDGPDARSITFERIVVLFFFIRDLAVRAIRQKINWCFIRFMEWSVAFIRQHVCQWVQQHGGWEAVLRYVFARKLLVKAGLVLVAVGATLALASAIIYWQKHT